MSRSMKRNFYRAYRSAYEEHGGRVPIIRKDHDKDVSHAKPCYLCVRGTVPKRVLHVKPRRRKEKRQLRAEVRASLDA